MMTHLPRDSYLAKDSTPDDSMTGYSNAHGRSMRRLTGPAAQKADRGAENLL
jgi:hypothetical protein